jgi:hypothetical protein
MLLHTIVCRQVGPALQQALPTAADTNTTTFVDKAAYPIAPSCYALAGFLEQQQPHLPANPPGQLHSLALLLAIPYAPGEAELGG